jgi:aminoglycoside phosphotransferase (APT) family kinase protein
MQFYKSNWERKQAYVSLPETELQQMVSVAFPNDTIESYELIHSGANTNICFKLLDKKDLFLLRIYSRDIHAINLEVALSEKLGQKIPMPEFLYINRENLKYPYAIKRWIKGQPLYQILNTLSTKQNQTVAQEIASVLNIISSHKFSKAGFFKDNLDIIPFESKNNEHPFVTYIKECLFEKYTGKWLGESLTDRTWKFVIDNQALFPVLEPACLVQGDFNPDNIILNEKTLKIAVILDWEYSFSGSYLFDIGNLLRRDILPLFEENFIKIYEKESHITLPLAWKKIIKIQDLSNLMGLLDIPSPCPKRINDIKALIENTLSMP